MVDTRICLAVFPNFASKLITRACVIQPSRHPISRTAYKPAPEALQHPLMSTPTPPPPSHTGRQNRAVPPTVSHHTTIVRTYTSRGTLTSIITNGRCVPLGFGRPSRLDILAAAAEQLNWVPTPAKPMVPPKVRPQPALLWHSTDHSHSLLRPRLSHSRWELSRSRKFRKGPRPPPPCLHRFQELYLILHPKAT